jgi:hypothetical protein
MQVSAVLSELVASGVFTGDQRELDHLAAPAVVPDLTEASRLAGFPVRTVDPSALPAGVRATPERILVSHAQTARITFDRDKAIAYLRQGGQAQATIPRRFDGTQLVVQVPAIVVQQYAGRDGAPRLLVAKAGTLGVDAVGGASLAELRELVLRLPGLPAKAVAQLRAVGDWRTTLPLPVPSDQLRWQRASVGGAEALAFADSAGRLHALLWRRGGYIWGVAGAVGAAEALDVANSLD